MSTRRDFEPSRTYASEETLLRAVENKLQAANVKFAVVWTKEGRCYPVFFNAGGDHALALNIAYLGWPVVN